MYIKILTAYTYGTNVMQRRTREYHTRECEWQRSHVRVQTLANTSNIRTNSKYKAKLCRYMARPLYKQ